MVLKPTLLAALRSRVGASPDWPFTEVIRSYTEMAADWHLLGKQRHVSQQHFQTQNFTKGLAGQINPMRMRTQWMRRVGKVGQGGGEVGMKCDVTMSLNVDCLTWNSQNRLAKH